MGFRKVHMYNAVKLTANSTLDKKLHAYKES